MGFSRQEYWSGLPFPSPGDLPNPRIKPVSPASQAASLPLSNQRSPISCWLMAWTLKPRELWVPPNSQPWEDEVSQPQDEKPATRLKGAGKHTGPADPAEPQETRGFVLFCFKIYHRTILSFFQKISFLFKSSFEYNLPKPASSLPKPFTKTKRCVFWAPLTENSQTH